MTEEIYFKYYAWYRSMNRYKMLHTSKYQNMIAREIEPDSPNGRIVAALAANADKMIVPVKDKEENILWLEVSQFGSALFFALPQSIKTELLHIHGKSFMRMSYNSAERYINDWANELYKKQDDRRETFTNNVNSLRHRMIGDIDIYDYKGNAKRLRTRYHMVADVLDFVLNPCAVIAVPIAKQWECLTAITALDNEVRISVVGKFANDKKRISKKSGSFFGWAFDIVNQGRWHSKDREWFTSTIGSIWTELTANGRNVQMLTGQALIAAYRDDPGVHSCMSDNPDNCLALYAEHPDKFRMLVVKRMDEVKRRALIVDCGLRLPDGTVLWALDREYGTSQSNSEKNIGDLLVDTELEYEGCAYYSLAISNNDNKIVDTIYVTKAYNRNKTMFHRAYVEIILSESTEYLPYIDTWMHVKIYNRDNRTLRLYHEYTTCSSDYKSQNGNSNHTTHWTEGSDQVWSDYHNEYIYRENATYSEWLGSYIDLESDYIQYVRDLEDYLPSDETFYCEECDESFALTNTGYYECHISGNTICENCVSNISIVNTSRNRIDNVEVTDRYTSNHSRYSDIVEITDDGMVDWLTEMYFGDADYDLYAKREDYDGLIYAYQEYMDEQGEEDEEEEETVLEVQHVTDMPVAWQQVLDPTEKPEEEVCLIS